MQSNLPIPPLQNPVYPLERKFRVPSKFAANYRWKTSEPINIAFAFESLRDPVHRWIVSRRYRIPKVEKKAKFPSTSSRASCWSVRILPSASAAEPDDCFSLCALAPRASALAELQIKGLGNGSGMGWTSWNLFGEIGVARELGWDCCVGSWRLF